MSVEEKIKMIEDCLDLDEGTLQPDSVLEELEEWDSMSKLALMAEIKDQYKIRLAPEELAEFRMVRDVLAFLDENCC